MLQALNRCKHISKIERNIARGLKSSLLSSSLSAFTSKTFTNKAQNVISSLFNLLQTQSLFTFEANIAKIAKIRLLGRKIAISASKNKQEAVNLINL